ncbi:hypothetical protein L1887_11502 [Cichorium endivia]|nr:hypothetical protein L1887_11502 [Cichorium endivia]
MWTVISMSSMAASFSNGSSRISTVIDSTYRVFCCVCDVDVIILAMEAQEYRRFAVVFLDDYVPRLLNGNL